MIVLSDGGYTAVPLHRQVEIKERRYHQLGSRPRELVRVVQDRFPYPTSPLTLRPVWEQRPLRKQYAHRYDLMVWHSEEIRPDITNGVIYDLGWFEVFQCWMWLDNFDQTARIDATPTFLSADELADSGIHAIPKREE